MLISQIPGFYLFRMDSLIVDNDSNIWLGIYHKGNEEDKVYSIVKTEEEFQVVKRFRMVEDPN